MSLTQERINALIWECWNEIAKEGKGMDPIRFGNLFLSRSREEQEPSGYFRDGWNGREEVSDIHKDEEGVEPLFTIPPAAPYCPRRLDNGGMSETAVICGNQSSADVLISKIQKAAPDCSCKELVEALESCRGQWIHSIHAEKNLSLIAKHKASMGEK